MAMEFKYVRIQGKALARNTMYAKGVFSLINQMAEKGLMEQEDVDLFREVDDWFVQTLPWPPQCQRQEPVVCWFKTANSAQMMKMIRPILWLLERYHQTYYLVYTNDPGEIVYEDEYQVVVKTDHELLIEEVQKSWSPEELK